MLVVLVFLWVLLFLWRFVVLVLVLLPPMVVVVAAMGCFERSMEILEILLAVGGGDKWELMCFKSCSKITERKGKRGGVKQKT